MSAFSIRKADISCIDILSAEPAPAFPKGHRMRMWKLGVNCCFFSHFMLYYFYSKKKDASFSAHTRRTIRKRLFAPSEGHWGAT